MKFKAGDRVVYTGARHGESVTESLTMTGKPYLTIDAVVGENLLIFQEEPMRRTRTQSGYPNKWVARVFELYKAPVILDESLFEA